jgi:hypothetical protein
LQLPYLEQKRAATRLNEIPKESTLVLIALRNSVRG